MKTPPKVLLLAVIGGFCISKAAAVPITTLFNTGVNGSGVVLPNGSSPDPHYVLTGVPGGTTNTLVRTSGGGFPIGPWIGDNSLSAWIGPPNLTSPAGDYFYQTTFDLTGLNAASASISGKWATDNAGVDIYLNGNPTGQSIPYGQPSNYSFGAWTSFSLASGFVAGLNTIDFKVRNGNGADDLAGPTGLRVEMSGTAAVPDGGMTVALLGMSLSGLAFLRRKLA